METARSGFGPAVLPSWLGSSWRPTGPCTLGFPTANLEVRGAGEGGKLIPPPGIYAVRGTVRLGTFDGALHVGPRPTFRGSPPTIELHLLGFEDDIYGEEVRVDFVKYLREVRPFETSEALVAQMQEDVRTGA